MTESSDRPEKGSAILAEPPQPGAGERPPSGDAQQQRPGQPVPLTIDDSKAIASYANFCRVTGTPEELIIDFGLNDHPFGAQAHPIAITQRIVTNFYTAKRLLQVLHMTIQRHEAAFGVLETDVQKRAKPGAASRIEPPRGAS